MNSELDMPGTPGFLLFTDFIKIPHKLHFRKLLQIKNKSRVWFNSQCITRPPNFPTLLIQTKQAVLQALECIWTHVLVLGWRVLDHLFFCSLVLHYHASLLLDWLPMTDCIRLTAWIRTVTFQTNTYPVTPLINRSIELLWLHKICHLEKGN